MNLSLQAPRDGDEHDGQLSGILQRKGPGGDEKTSLVFRKVENGLEAVGAFPGDEPLKVTLSMSENGKAAVRITRNGELIHEYPGILRWDQRLESILNHRSTQPLPQLSGTDVNKSGC